MIPGLKHVPTVDPRVRTGLQRCQLVVSVAFVMDSSGTYSKRKALKDQKFFHVTCFAVFSTLCQNIVTLSSIPLVLYDKYFVDRPQQINRLKKCILTPALTAKSEDSHCCQVIELTGLNLVKNWYSMEKFFCVNFFTCLNICTKVINSFLIEISGIKYIRITL